ncbi:MAG TPA: hypothetical protein VFM25_12550, partial [Verrucomicrobiae bacterium]|nr:hypothetical protein [Verrucomicrobiae bacterium]
MNLRTDLLNGIERFLDVIPAQTRKRGRDYQANGHVIELECVEPDHLFAAIVRGSKDYRVGLEYSENHWFSDCS